MRSEWHHGTSRCALVPLLLCHLSCSMVLSEQLLLCHSAESPPPATHLSGCVCVCVPLSTMAQEQLVITQTRTQSPTQRERERERTKRERERNRNTPTHMCVRARMCARVCGRGTCHSASWHKRKYRSRTAVNARSKSRSIHSSSCVNESCLMCE